MPRNISFIFEPRKTSENGSIARITLKDEFQTVRKKAKKYITPLGLDPDLNSFAWKHEK